MWPRRVPDMGEAGWISSMLSARVQVWRLRHILHRDAFRRAGALREVEPPHAVEDGRGPCRPGALDELRSQGIDLDVAAIR